jgi:DNA-binding transcriptional ArsR family regulator
MAACKSVEVHPKEIEEAKKRVLETKPEELSNFFKILSGETRIKILLALSGAQLCVCDLVEVLDMTASAISHQLKELRQARLVKSQREGKSVYYSLQDEHVQSLLHMTSVHLDENGL